MSSRCHMIGREDTLSVTACGASMINVLFLCTGNTARSILGEALLRHLGAGRFAAFSAGSQPKGVVNPLALRVLTAAAIPTEGLSSKSWQVFSHGGAPVMNLVITACDSAAAEACPSWPGHPSTAHWGIPDPAAVTGTEAAREEAFRLALDQMRARIAAFLAEVGDAPDATRAAAAARRVADHFAPDVGAQG